MCPLLPARLHTRLPAVSASARALSLRHCQPRGSKSKLPSDGLQPLRARGGVRGGSDRHQRAPAPASALPPPGVNPAGPGRPSARIRRRLPPRAPPRRGPRDADRRSRRAVGCRGRAGRAPSQFRDVIGALARWRRRSRRAEKSARAAIVRCELARAEADVDRDGGAGGEKELEGLSPPGETSLAALFGLGC